MNICYQSSTSKFPKRTNIKCREKRRANISKHKYKNKKSHQMEIENSNMLTIRVQKISELKQEMDPNLCK